MTPHRLSPAALVLLVLLAGCHVADEDSANGGDNDEDDAPPIPVETSKPSRGDIYAVYAGTAPIEAFAEADVVAKVAGEVREILVEEGDEVKKGQILARLDGDRLRLELNESEARLGKLQRDYERNVDLREKGLISAGDFEKIKFEMDALQASYNLAKLELDYTRIRAPIDGVVSERYIKLGNTMQPNDALFRVTGFDPLVAYLHVPEREYKNIETGQTVAIDIDALPGETVIATVTRVSPIVDPNTGTFKITIEISDEFRRIKPGMFGRMSVVYDQHENALQLPRSAIVEDLGQSSVFVVEDDIAVRKNIETGFSNRGMIEIIAGVDDNENVVTVGQIGLKADAQVTVINAPESTNAGATEELNSGDTQDSASAATD